jgi:hypothetical protein
MTGLTGGKSYDVRVLQDISDQNAVLLEPAAVSGGGSPTPTPVPVPAPGTPVPHGPAGNWALKFNEEFLAAALNAAVWDARDGWTHQNNVTDRASNVILPGDGTCHLRLSDATDGAAIACKTYQWAVGDYIEAILDFAGSGGQIFNWPAWWASGPNWPAAGENDIAEGLGTLTVNYHSPSGAHNTGTVPGSWSEAMHSYGAYRGPNYVDEYWDGQHVRHYSTDDNGQPEQLILTNGAGNRIVTGAAGDLIIDAVRAFSPVG